MNGCIYIGYSSRNDEGIAVWGNVPVMQMKGFQYFVVKTAAHIHYVGICPGLDGYLTIFRYGQQHEIGIEILPARIQVVNGQSYLIGRDSFCNDLHCGCFRRLRR